MSKPTLDSIATAKARLDWLQARPLIGYRP